MSEMKAVVRYLIEDEIGDPVEEYVEFEGTNVEDVKNKYLDYMEEKQQMSETEADEAYAGL